MEYSREDFKHRMSVTCTIGDEIINDAKICVEDDEIFICQNLKDGMSAGDKLGYDFSWSIIENDSVRLDGFDINVKNLVLIQEEVSEEEAPILIRKIEDGLKEGDVVVDTDDDECEVLGVCGRAVFLSGYDNFNSGGATRTLKEIIDDGFILKQPESEKIVPQYTMEQLFEKLGEFEIIE